MKTLLTMQSLTLLLLLLEPLPLQVLMKRRYPDITGPREEEFKDFWDELHSTGPTKPPTKKIFQNHVIIPPSFPLYYSEMCTFEIRDRDIYNRFYRCRKEHFFLQVAYEELQETCSSKFVACKNGVRRCHKTKKIIEGLHCKLISGIRMPECTYEHFLKKGYALITCQWQDDVAEIIPEHVNDILEISGKQ